MGPVKSHTKFRPNRQRDKYVFSETEMILAGGKQGGTWLLNVEKYDIEGVLTAAPNLSYRRYVSVQDYW